MTLCSEGWTFSAISHLRTMSELMLSAAVIVSDPKLAEYRGFKYSHHFLKVNMNNPAFSAEQRDNLRKQIQDGVDHLSEEFREKAKQFMYTEKQSPYWYYPDFHRPTEVIDRLCPDEVSQLYTLFSSGAHGGFLGLRLLKDNPDKVHPNPRSDKRSQNVALCGTIRLTLETIRSCDQFENSGVNGDLTKRMFENFRALKPLLGSA